MGIGNKIGVLCQKSGVSLRQLALKANVPYSTLYCAVKRDSNGIDAGALTGIAKALGIDLMSIFENEEVNPQPFTAGRKMGRPGDLIRREDAVNAIRTACIRKHIPFNSSSPEGRRALEAIWAVHTTPAAIPAAELEGVKDYTRLRKLLKADREDRCFVLMVPPNRNSEKSDVIICEDGDAYLCRVVNVCIGLNENGEMNYVYEVEGGDFETADIGVTVFLPNETEKIEAALKKMREEEQG